jgi:hypothetical protein
MENKYAGDFSDFAKFILLKNLFNDKKIAVVWYLTPDRAEPEYSFKFKVCQKNTQIYEYASKIDKDAAFQFNLICKNSDKFYVGKLESLQILDNIKYFDRCVIGAFGDGRNYRQVWLDRALEKTWDCEVVYLDSDYGLPIDYRISVVKAISRVSFPEKYLTLEEIKEFLLGKDALIFHNRYPVGIEHDKVHSTVFRKLRKEFRNKFLYIIKQNPFTPRFFVLISRYNLERRLKEFLLTEKLCDVKPFKGLFTLVLPENYQY